MANDAFLAGFPPSDPTASHRLMTWNAGRRDPTPTARRFGELIWRPGVLAHIQARIRESREEYHARWFTNENRGRERDRRFIAGDTVPGDGWVWHRRRNPVTGVIEDGWVPEHLGIECEPEAGGPLPRDDRRPLSIADCYIVAALDYEDTRGGASPICPWGDDEPLGEAFWKAQLEDFRGLYRDDTALLTECMAAVEQDLRACSLLAGDADAPSAPLPTPPTPPVEPDGPCEPYGFRWGGKVLDLAEATLRHKLLSALWDAKAKAPHKSRELSDVMAEVYGDDEGRDQSLKDLCKQTRKELLRADVPLTIRTGGDKVWLVASP